MTLRGFGTEFHDTTIEDVEKSYSRTFGQDTDSTYEFDVSPSSSPNNVTFTWKRAKYGWASDDNPHTLLEAYDLASSSHNFLEIRFTFYNRDDFHPSNTVYFDVDGTQKASVSFNTDEKDTKTTSWKSLSSIPHTVEARVSNGALSRSGNYAEVEIRTHNGSTSDYSVTGVDKTQ